MYRSKPSLSYTDGKSNRTLQTRTLQIACKTHDVTDTGLGTAAKNVHLYSKTDDSCLWTILGPVYTFGWQEGYAGGNLGKKGQELSPPAPIFPIEILLWL